MDAEVMCCCECVTAVGGKLHCSLSLLDHIKCIVQVGKVVSWLNGWLIEEVI